MFPSDNMEWFTATCPSAILQLGQTLLSVKFDNTLRSVIRTKCKQFLTTSDCWNSDYFTHPRQPNNKIQETVFKGNKNQNEISVD